MTESEGLFFRMIWWLSGSCAELQIDSQGFNPTVDTCFLMEEGVEFKYSTSQSVQGIEKSLSPGICDTDWVLNIVSTHGFVGW